MAILSVRNLSKTYAAHTLFEDLSITFQPNERVGLIGPNGAGKTTLLRILAEDEVPVEYLYEPSEDALLAEIIPRYIYTQMFSMLLESIASEHGSRMTAMDSATNNATEMTAKLTLLYNRARQSAITTELMEIVSGAEALNS